jgi:hypothetical protein
MPAFGMIKIPLVRHKTHHLVDTMGSLLIIVAMTIAVPLLSDI